MAAATAHECTIKVCNEQEQELKRKLHQAETALKFAEAELTKWSSLQPVDAPVMLERERLFHSIVQAKISQSRDGSITASGLRGRPITLMKIPSAEKGSDAAVERTRKRRSQILERASQIVSGSESTSSSATVAQQADLISRNRSAFLTAANKAGINIFGSFELKDIARLSVEIPLRTLGMLKRMFRESFGCDPFASLEEIRHKRADLSFNFECGSFQDEDGHEINFLRVTDIDSVLKKTMAELHNNGRLEQLTCWKEKELCLLLPVDKGGCSTKMVLQVLNSSNRHSTSTARLLAFFRGEDTWQNMKTVFSPVIEAMYARAKRIAELKLPLPPLKTAKPTKATKKAYHLELKLFRQLEQLGITFQTENKTISSACRMCYCICPVDAEDQAINSDGTAETCTIVAGGDWLSEATLLGLTGPKGRHFCNFCLAKLSDLTKGQPHAPVILPRYQNYSALSKDFRLRTFEGLKADHDAYVSTGSAKSKVADFNNSTLAPLLPAEGLVIKGVSCTPLHIFLGLADQAVKEVEQRAVTLDREVKAHHGLASCQLEDLFKKRAHEQISFLNASAEAEELMCAAEEAEAAVTSLKQQHAAFLVKQNGRYIATTKEARDCQRLLRTLLQQQHQTDADKRRAQKSKAAAQQALVDADTKLEAAQGPFSQEFSNRLKKLHLKRCAYHGGALLGNDVHTVLQRENFCYLIKCLKPKSIKLTSGVHKEFGSMHIFQKALTLFSKIHAVYELATANRPLCQHEVALLKVRCYSLGNFLPVNFPDASVKPKLHVLVHHFGQKAEFCGSVGIETEQLIEGMHPFVNRRSCQYCSVRNPAQHMALIAQSQWVASGTHVPSDGKEK